MSHIHGRLGKLLAALASISLVGCQIAPPARDSGPAYRLPPVFQTVPRELSKVSLPEYVIEPPDILQIEGIHIVPRPPYRLKTLDVITVEATGVLPEEPIAGLYSVEPGGVVNLGAPYGAVKVAGLTVDEARAAILKHLEGFVNEADATVALAQLAASQQIFGQFLVAPDGTVTLGSYGSIYVVGKTLAQAKLAVETHLSQFLENPEIALNIFAFNSKVYYVVLQGAGLGDGVFRFPITGNETVLDAISQVQGLEQVSSKKIWISRPSRGGRPPQVMPVDWFAITEEAGVQTNYQVLPGDRIFIAEDKLIAWDTKIAKFTAPLERVMGFTLLGTGTATRLSGRVLQGGGNPRNQGF
ncbi:MAG: polysaccharide biosynthesis/export family protein [Planctomycetota bacterium]|nr:polysaccharide biosynthesis/export family protein [Planctomycetota bacterium]MDA1177225.1 polysaccharide biosynthesis/export family protein [Planctomycetota bacterium]